MKIIWGYLLWYYWKIAALCLSIILGILFVSQLREIARFVLCATSVQDVLLFALFQFPTLLPSVLPIVCFVAGLASSILLTNSKELTAFRTSGVSVFQLTLPISWGATLLMLLGFFFTCQLAPIAQNYSYQLLRESIANNPLSLIRTESTLALKKVYTEAEKETAISLENFLVVTKYNEKMAVLLLKELNQLEGALNAHHLTFIASQKDKEGADFFLLEENESVNIAFSTLLSLLDLSLEDSKIHMSQLSLSELCSHEKSCGQPKIFFGFCQKSLCEILLRIVAPIAMLLGSVLGWLAGIQTSRRLALRSIIGSILAIGFYFSAQVVLQTRTITDIKILLIVAFAPLNVLLAYIFILFQKKQRGIG